MKHYRDEWIREWCDANGWSDLYAENNLYWAFPPNGVMPQPIPIETMRSIKRKNGLSQQEKRCTVGLIILTATALAFTILYSTPMFLLLAFSVASLTIALLDISDI